MSANRGAGLSEDTRESSDMRSGRACSPPVPGPPTANNTQVTREGASSSLGISPMRGPLTSSVNVTLGSSIHHSSNTRSDFEQISLETPHGSRDDSTFPLNNRPGGSETGMLLIDRLNLTSNSHTPDAGLRTPNLVTNEIGRGDIATPTSQFSTRQVSEFGIQIKPTSNSVHRIEQESTSPHEDPTVESLSDVFRCFICMERLRNAHLCPHCSKLCCYLCIRRWLTEQRSQCPHCRASLHIHELVNCRWVEEVTQQLETLRETGAVGTCSSVGNEASKLGPSNTDSDPSKDRCTSHSEKLSVYCWTCRQCICHQCALWGGTHTGHTFKPLEEIYDQHVSHIKEEVSLLRRRLMELISMVQELDSEVETFREAKDEKVREIRNAVELNIGQLDLQLKQYVLVLIDQKKGFSEEAEDLQCLIREFDNCIKSKTRSELIENAPDLLQLSTGIKRTPTTNFVKSSTNSVFQSEIIPNFESSKIILSQFSTLKMETNAVYSDPLEVNGITWRLKVYPGGNGAARGEYLSVFLELTSGLPEACKYDFKVEMIYQNNERIRLKDNERSVCRYSKGFEHYFEISSKNVVREFTSDFEVGECWGYNRFFKLDLLASEGYLNAVTDTVIIRFHVRPPTFFQQCRDQKWYIRKLNCLQLQYKDQIDELDQRLCVENVVAKQPERKPLPNIEASCPSPSYLESNILHRKFLRHNEPAFLGDQSYGRTVPITDFSEGKSSHCLSSFDYASSRRQNAVNAVLPSRCTRNLTRCNINKSGKVVENEAAMLSNQFFHECNEANLIDEEGFDEVDSPLSLEDKELNEENFFETDTITKLADCQTQFTFKSNKTKNIVRESRLEKSENAFREDIDSSADEILNLIAEVDLSSANYRECSNSENDCSDQVLARNVSTIEAANTCDNEMSSINETIYLD